ncbi:MAG: hypothetical protein H0V62_11850 [Gammaproteobacteria bacterium]|nr:hypothetical protein [Gammaproteobacteria bacterium]
MQGKLFTLDFLSEGIRRTDAWRGLDKSDIERFKSELIRIFAAFPADATPNEAVTESEIIFKLLAALGWTHYLPQQTTSGKGRRDVPDILLFADETAKQKALKEKQDDRRYLHGLAIVESKRWQRPLDRGEETDRLDPGAPSNQILRYLTRAEIASDKAIQWGMLTNGRHWRLYYQQARSRSEEFIEFDVAALAGQLGLQSDPFSPESGNDSRHYLRVFYLLFRRDVFLPQPGERRSFHRIARDESRLWEARVSEDLGAAVFDRIFPRLVAALAQHDAAAPAPLNAEYLEQVRRAALILLYRLLFVFYAEDRYLLGAGCAIRRLLATHGSREHQEACGRQRYFQHRRLALLRPFAGTSTPAFCFGSTGRIPIGSQSRKPQRRRTGSVVPNMGKSKVVAAAHRKFREGVATSEQLADLVRQSKADCAEGGIHWLPLTHILFVRAEAVYRSCRGRYISTCDRRPAFSLRDRARLSRN